MYKGKSKHRLLACSCSRAGSLTCFFLFAIFHCCTAFADPKISIITESRAYHRQIAELIKEKVSRARPDVPVEQIFVDDDGLSPAEPDTLLVTVGTKAAVKTHMLYPENAQLAVFITRQSWRQIESQYATSSTQKAAVFLDQPVERYLLLADVLMPEARNVATALGPVSKQYKARLLTSAARLDKTLHVVEMDQQSNPLLVLTPLLSNSDIFVSIPDQQIFNKNIARWALQLGFREKRPVLGFSQSYTNAGALASLFTSPDDVARQGSEWLLDYLKNPQAAHWTAQDPAYFTLGINVSVAHALGLPITSESKIHDLLSRKIARYHTP